MSEKHVVPGTNPRPAGMPDGDFDEESSPVMDDLGKHYKQKRTPSNLRMSKVFVHRHSRMPVNQSKLVELGTGGFLLNGNHTFIVNLHQVLAVFF